MIKPTTHQLSLIDDIIDEFNFEKVHKAMIALDWKWAISIIGDDGSLILQVPTLARLKEFARYQLISSIKSGFYSSGGLKAEYFPVIQEEATEGGAIKQYAQPEYFVLTFELTSTCSGYEFND
jgi:hypothetical protein